MKSSVLDFFSNIIHFTAHFLQPRCHSAPRSPDSSSILTTSSKLVKSKRLSSSVSSAPNQKKLFYSRDVEELKIRNQELEATVFKLTSLIRNSDLLQSSSAKCERGRLIQGKTTESTHSSACSSPMSTTSTGTLQRALFRSDSEKALLSSGGACLNLDDLILSRLLPSPSSDEVKKVVFHSNTSFGLVLGFTTKGIC